MSEEHRTEIQNDLLDVLYKNEAVNAVSRRPVILEMDQINSFLTCRFQFKPTSTFVDTSTPFQLTIAAQPDSPPLPLRFGFLRLSFSDPYFNLHLHDDKSDNENTERVQLIDCRECAQEDVDDVGRVWTKSVDLAVKRGVAKVFEGVVVPKESGELTFMTASLGIITPVWKLELNFRVDNGGEDGLLRRKWLQIDEGTQPRFVSLEGTGDQSSIKITQKRASLDVETRNATPALLEEQFPVDIVVTNRELEDVKVLVNAELASINALDTDDYITSSPSAHGTTMLSNVDIGVVPAGDSAIKTMYVFGRGSSALRILRLSVWYALATGVPTSPPPTQGWIEKSKEVQIPYAVPFEVTFETFPQGDDEEEGSDLSSEGLLRRTEQTLCAARVVNAGPWDLDVLGVELEMPKESRMQGVVRLLASSVDESQVGAKQVWKPEYVYQANYLLAITTPDVLSSTAGRTQVELGALVVKWQRHASGSDDLQQERQVTNSTVFAIPAYETQKPELKAIVAIPPNPTIDTLFTLTYTLRNPTMRTAEVMTTVEASESFVISGYKQTLLRVLPLGARDFRVNCFPLAAGKVRLPHVRFIDQRAANSASEESAADKEVRITAPGLHEPAGNDGFVVFVNPKRSG